MNREQIKEKFEAICEAFDFMKADPVYKADLAAIVDLAINSIPKAFNAEDETTWPQQDDNYLCFWWRENAKHGPLHSGGKYELTKDTWSRLSGGWIAQKHDQIYTHYMPIPEVGESK